ncbi:MAG: diphthine--ammonia ligase [Firmicutes bacterium]|nr:diphthine--ammonia ligase [Bacillota bacterium]
MQLVCSWSGGKDSCLALYRALQAGGTAKCLLTMVNEQNSRSRSHGLEPAFLQAQARLLNVEHRWCPASWDNYEQVFVHELRKLAGCGVTHAVFGDIDIAGHREWEESVCRQAGIQALLPLWRLGRDKVLDQFIDAGFKAVIVVINRELMDTRFLGRVLDRQTIEELTACGIDPCGEQGEFHTAVVDGPLFARPLAWQPRGSVAREAHVFLDIELKEEK